MTTVAITTLGCKANWADSEALSQRLAAAGIEIVPFDAEAEIYVVNTCTVTALASAQSRQTIRRALRRAPSARVIAAGCLGEMSRDSLARIRGVEAVFGAAGRGGLADHILRRAGLAPDPCRGDAGFGPVPDGAQSRARAFLKIQDGCDKRCAYCIITMARGASRSMPAADAVAAARRLGRHHREIVLAGIDVGQYGLDLEPHTSILELIAALAADPAVPRVRLSSLGPGMVDARLAGAIASGGICRHVHLSIQSGADPVLARMRRGYRAGDAAAAAERLAAAVPGIAVTGDLIAGLPGETRGDHEATMRLIEKMPIAGLHVFPYSPRDGTEAARMPGQVPHAVRRGRAADLRALAAEKRGAFLEGLIGTPLDVIVTSRGPDRRGMVEAFSDNGVSVSLPAGKIGYGQLGRASIASVSGVAAAGEWL